MPLTISKQSPKGQQNRVISYSPLNGNFEAIQQLKDADRQLDMMKRRISVLKIKQEKNNSQTQLALKKLKYHKMVQQMQNKRKIQNENYRNQVQSRIERQKAVNSSQRSQRKKRIVETKINLLQRRSNSFIEQKLASKQINNRLKQLNQEQYLSRKQIRDSIRNSQMMSRKNYDIFREQRKSSIRYYRDQQQSRIIDLKEKREYEMRQLARIEIQLLQRQSRSRQNAQKTIRQLASHYNTSNKRLPSTELSHSESANPQSDFS